jgi:hypothetical protein
MPGVVGEAVVVVTGEAADEIPTGTIRSRKATQIRMGDRLMPVLFERYVE